jgi:hypothetical protein
MQCYKEQEVLRIHGDKVIIAIKEKWPEIVIQHDMAPEHIEAMMQSLWWQL